RARVAGVDRFAAAAVAAGTRAHERPGRARRPRALAHRRPAPRAGPGEVRRLMLLAAAAPQADTTVIAAFAVGFVSFVSPCVLPRVPGYLWAVPGVSFTDMRQGSHRLSHVLWPAAIFCLSFTLMFVALGMTATGLGSTLRDSKATLDKAAGIL